MTDDNPNHVTCPQRRRISNRRSEQSLWRGRKRWKNFVAEHCHTKESVCVHCGRHHGEPRKNGKLTVLTINHLSRALYNDEELYHTWNPELMEVCCTMCNWMYEDGRKPCPVCRLQYIRALEPDNMCQGCYDRKHPEEAIERKEKANAKKLASKALLKKLRDAEKEKVKQWKATHKKGGGTMGVLSERNWC